MSLAVESLLVDQILAIWQADTAFTTAYPAGRRVKQTRDGQVRAIILRAPGDYPQIWLEAEGGSAARDAPKTFAQQSTSYTPATCDIPVPMEQRIIIRTVLDRYDLAALSAAEQVWKRLLWAKFPKLGLTWCCGWTETFTRGMRPFPEPTDVKRFVSTFTLTFQLRPFLSQLAS